MLCHDGIVSLIGFLGNFVASVITSILVIFYLEIKLNNPENALICLIGPVGLFLVTCALSYVVLNREDFEIIVRAGFLGLIFGVATIVTVFSPTVWTRFGAYFIFMSIFHFSEYLAIAYSNPRTLNTDTFMLNHSMAYTIAAVTSWFEFFIEIYFWPWLKHNIAIFMVGITICIIGEILRKLAIITANSNFNHVVQYRKAEDHNLVTHGVYKYMRHPSYAGWFWWSIGTQVILCNPVCIILYTIVSWKFFHARIFMEEITLVNFFQQKYLDYQKRTCTGVPFIRGYIYNEHKDTTNG